MPQENSRLVSAPDPSSPEDVDVAVADFQSEDDVDPGRVTAESTWKKCTASMVGACACRNPRHDVSVEWRRTDIDRELGAGRWML